MFPQFCCQDIILCLLKCRKIHALHLGYIDSLFVAHRFYETECNFFLVEDSMHISTADIVVERTFSLLVSCHGILRKGAGRDALFPGTLAHMDLISCKFDIFKRCIIAFQGKETSGNLCPCLFLRKYGIHRQKSHSTHGASCFHTVRIT